MIATKTFTTALKFAAHASAKKDIRTYLKGVLFEFKGAALTLVATDGARAAYIALPLAHHVYDTQFIVATESVTQLLALFSKDKGEVSFKVDLPAAPGKPPTLAIEAAGVTTTPKINDGTFPYWGRIVPPVDREQGTMPRINSVFLAEACAAIQPLCVGKTSKQIDINAAGEQNPVVVRPAYINNCAVVIMPINKDAK